MGIDVACVECDSFFDAPDESAGEIVQCPFCNQLTTIPKPRPKTLEQPRPKTLEPPVYVDSGTDNTGGVIPYKNPHALIAYYLGLFSIFPVLGLFLAVPAFILGTMGLVRRNRNPQIRGSIHAWIGIVMGGIMTVVWLVVMAMIVISIVTGA